VKAKQIARILVRHDKDELREKIFKAADRMALERGSAAVGIDAIQKETGGGRMGVSNGVNAWKTKQKARAVDLPPSLLLMAKRMAEEAWILALIMRDAEPSDTPPPRGRPEKEQPVPKPLASEPELKAVRILREQPAVASVRKEVWAKAENPAFARLFAEALRAAEHPLFAREFETAKYPPSKLDDFVPTKPGRAISRALAGSLISSAPTGLFWFSGETPPARPTKKRPYQSVGTGLALLRAEFPNYIEKGIKFIESKYPETVHFSDVWAYANPPPELGFRTAAFRAGLRKNALKDDARSKTLGDGQYRGVRPRARK
jgi:hypothetical protein